MTDRTNPKDLVGVKKPPLSLFPYVALVHGSMAMADGDSKYDAFNWREKDVQAKIYVEAAIRHIQAWFGREETAQDSGVHHLGHAIACCAILLDAQATGCLIDNRPENNPDLEELYAELKPVLERINARKKERLQNSCAGAPCGPAPGSLHYYDARDRESIGQMLARNGPDAPPSARRKQD